MGAISVTPEQLRASAKVYIQASQEIQHDYRAKGFQYFDLGGCVPTEDKESYYYRHYHFKKKFGGELIDSYTYFRIRGFYRIFYCIFDKFVQLFFKGDVNGFTNWLNQKGILR